MHDLNESNSRLHGQEQVVFADAGYLGLQKRPDAKPEMLWHVVMRPGKRKALDKCTAQGALLYSAEKFKPGVRAKVEQPFRVIPAPIRSRLGACQGLKKNTQQLMMLFALTNLRMVRSKLMWAQGVSTLGNRHGGQKRARVVQMTAKKTQI